jgi:hypothetical protein
LPVNTVADQRRTCRSAKNLSLFESEAPIDFATAGTEAEMSMLLWPNSAVNQGRERLTRRLSFGEMRNDHDGRRHSRQSANALADQRREVFRMPLLIAEVNVLNLALEAAQRLLESQKPAW